ncbi:MAG: PAS domain S-box protein [Hydrogenophaga sp.]|nr:PAS domain S-box protein [Hydrogenophaga sp.]
MLSWLNRSSLKFQLVVTIGSLAVLSGMLFSAAASHLARQQIQQDQSALLTHVAARLSARLAQDMNARAKEMLFLSRLDQVRDGGPDDATRLALLRRMQESYPFYAWLGMTDAQGTIISSTVSGILGASVAERDWFRSGLQGLHFGDVHDALLLSKLLPKNGENDALLRLVDVSTPVHDERGTLLGVLAAHMNLDWALETRQSVMDQLNRPDVDVIVVNAQGQVLLGSDRLPAEHTDLSGLRVMKRTGTSSPGAGLVEAWPDGQRYLTSAVSSSGFSLYPGLGWTVVVRTPEDVAFASAMRLQQLLAWGGLISAALFGLLLWWIVGRQLRPLERLSAAAQEMRHQDLATASPLPEPVGDSEVAHFSRSLAALVNALRDSQERFRRLFKHAPVPMGHIGSDGRILAQNFRFREVFGYAREDMRTLDDWWRQAFHEPQARERAQHAWQLAVNRAAATGAQIETSEFQVFCKDGSQRTVRLSAMVIEDGVLTAFHDVTQQREAEAELRLWAASFEQAELGLTISDARTNRLLAVNPAYARERGYEVAELVGQPVDVLYPPDRQDEVRRINTELDESSHGLFETEHVARDGRRFPVLLDMTVLRDHKGQPSRRVTYSLDLTERKRAEQALAAAQAAALEQQQQARLDALRQMEATQRARDAAEAAEQEVRHLNAVLEQRVAERTAELTAANRELDSFAYTVTHDLRAPLRTMRGFAEILAQEYGPHLNDDMRSCVEHIQQGSRRMGELIDGILTLSGVSRGELRHDSVDLTELATRRLAELAQSEPARRVAVDVQPGLSVQGDARMLDVLLTNLIENAWKYTGKAAQPAIRVYAGTLRGVSGVCVSDNGAGFDMRQAETLFEPFRRLHRMDEFDGTGVGLATVHRIVQRHGGQIVAEAQPGQGATFCFSLPCGEAPRDV